MAEKGAHIQGVYPHNEDQLKLERCVFLALKVLQFGQQYFVVFVGVYLLQRREAKFGPVSTIKIAGRASSSTAALALLASGKRNPKSKPARELKECQLICRPI